MSISCALAFDRLLFLKKEAMGEVVSEGLLCLSPGNRWCLLCSDFLKSDGNEARHATMIAVLSLECESVETMLRKFC